MIAFPAMLLGPAEEAGMKVPDDPENFDAEKFPHFQVYLTLQLGRPMPSPTSYWSNAKVIAAIPKDKIKTLSERDCIKLGFE